EERCRWDAERDLARHRPLQTLAKRPEQEVCAEVSSDPMLRAKVIAAFESVSPAHQATLECLADGCTAKEIAQRLGCSEGAARVRTHRARAALTELLSAVLNDVGIPGVGLAAATGAGCWLAWRRSLLVSLFALIPGVLLIATLWARRDRFRWAFLMM